MRIHLVTLALAAASWVRVARADGAFPDEMTVLLPMAAPHRILVGTNFGLAISEDDGASWRYACEPHVAGTSADLVSFYQLAPDGAVLAVSVLALSRSSDGGCTWARAGGSLSGLNTLDVFIDPNDATFVLAIAIGPGGTGLYPSHNGGVTFGAALFTTPDRLTGIEIARSTRGVVYATQVRPAGPGGPGSTYLLRSTDFGATWNATAIDAPSGTEARIAAVDPADANIVYLRLLSLSSDGIAITTDGGRTVPPPALSLSGNAISSFLRAADGTLYAGTLSGDLYVRPLGATSFSRRPGPHLRCLGQRAGTARIYACADGFLDGFNLGYSDDGGQTFQPLFRFTQLAGLLTCPAVQNACAAHWELLQLTLGIGGTPGPRPVDGGTSPPSASGGSNCAIGRGRLGSEAAALMVLLAFFLRRGKR